MARSMVMGIERSIAMDRGHTLDVTEDLAIGRHHVIRQILSIFVRRPFGRPARLPFATAMGKAKGSPWSLFHIIRSGQSHGRFAASIVAMVRRLMHQSLHIVKIIPVEKSWA